MGSWRAEFGKALVMLFSDFIQKKIKWASGQRLSLAGAEGSMLCQNREGLVTGALRTETATHVLFLDSDMTFPRNLLSRLLEHRKPIVGCNCTTRVSPIMPVAHDLNGKRFSSIGRQGLEKVQHVGLAVMLIETEVFKAMEPPLFLMDWIPEYRAYCGEDVYFAMKAQAAGYDTYIDNDLSREIGHVGTRICRHDMIESMGEPNDKR